MFFKIVFNLLPLLSSNWFSNLKCSFIMKNYTSSFMSLTRWDTRKREITMQTQLYTSIVYQTRHSSLLINSFYLIFKRLMTSILGLETRSFLQLNPQWQMVEDGDPRKYIIENLCRNIHMYQTSSSSFANYALGKTAQNQANISITEVVNTVLENV